MLGNLNTTHFTQNLAIMYTMSFVTVWTCKPVTEMHKNKCEAKQHSAAVPILDYEINAC